MKWIAALLLLPISSILLGQSKVKSFYFETNEVIPTKYSQQQFSVFKKSCDNGIVHILEINAYTDSTGTAMSNDSLAKARLQYFVERIKPDNDVQLHAYGLQRPYVVPKVLNYRRVDIVYEMGPKKMTQIFASNNEETLIIEEEEQVAPDVSHLNNDPEVKILSEAENGYKESISSQIPFVIDVQFKEGTSKILPVSYREITKVGAFLSENPNVHAQIRGHVCCGNNMRISRNRAKAVYKRLIKAGIPRSQLSYMGCSNKEPLVFPEVTSSDRQKNRRVDVKMTITN